MRLNACLAVHGPDVVPGGHQQRLPGCRSGQPKLTAESCLPGLLCVSLCFLLGAPQQLCLATPEPQKFARLLQGALGRRGRTPCFGPDRRSSKTKACQPRSLLGASGEPLASLGTLTLYLAARAAPWLPAPAAGLQHLLPSPPATSASPRSPDCRSQVLDGRSLLFLWQLLLSCSGSPCS